MSVEKPRLVNRSVFKSKFIVRNKQIYYQKHKILNHKLHDWKEKSILIKIPQNLWKNKTKLFQTCKKLTSVTVPQQRRLTLHSLHVFVSFMEILNKKFHTWPVKCCTLSNWWYLNERNQILRRYSANGSGKK